MSLYVFYGHGWDLDKNIEDRNIEIQDRNIEIYMLEKPTLLYESGNRQHRKVMATLYNTDDIFKYLTDIAVEDKNIFVKYTVGVDIPELLLSLIPRFTTLRGALPTGELCDLIKAPVKTIMLPWKVGTLSELIQHISSIEPGSFKIWIQTCRPILNKFQFESIPDAFGDVGGKIIMEKAINELPKE